jgi:hypothetical protein
MIARLLTLLLLAPLPAGAGALSDLLMAPHLFDAAPVGSSVAYAEERAVAEGGTLADVAGGTVRLEVVADDTGPALRLLRESDGAPQPLGTFPTGTANPLLLYFLETTVRATAEATGGSPYYIRNRIREALVAADLDAGEGGAASADGTRAVTLTPFAADANRARLGAFADLTIRLHVDPARPERILELSANTAAGADGYHETMVLIAED